MHPLPSTFINSCRYHLLVLAAALIPVSGSAQETGRGALPLEALQSRGQQSAVRVCAYTFVALDDELTGGRNQGFYQIIGSGVRFGVSNRVMTAWSVVAGADSIEVEVGDRRMPAVLLGADTNTQLALLSVNALLSSNAPPQPSRAPAREGDLVLMVDPLRDRTVLHQGEVRTVYPTGLIQTSLTAYPGLSGAPILNPQGDLVGIVTFMIRDQMGSGQGDAAAVPMDLAGHVATEIEEFGRVRWGWFGASYDVSITEHIVLSSVNEDGPAYLAGLQAGDVVTHYGGRELTDVEQLMDLVLATPPGTVVPVRASRGDAALEMNLVVGERPPVVDQQNIMIYRASPEEDAWVLAQLRALFEELASVFSRPGFDPENPDIRTRLVRLEREINELKRVSAPDRPPPPVS